MERCITCELVIASISASEKRTPAGRRPKSFAADWISTRIFHYATILYLVRFEKSTTGHARYKSTYASFYLSWTGSIAQKS